MDIFLRRCYNFRGGFMGIRIARVGLHHFEEPCISGKRGSGTVFFSGCNLKCLFCQNHVISHEGKGLEVSARELLDCMSRLEDMGAHNINLVTPSNYTNLLIPVLEQAKSRLKIPIVWNSSGYETVTNIKKLKGLVDIYLPDFKYSDDNMAFEYSCAKGYFEVAKKAIAQMRENAPDDVFDNDGMMLSGVIVRHLVLPEGVDNARGVMRAIADIDKDIYVSVMGQYFPTTAVADHQILGRRLTEDEYDAATDAFFNAGLHNGFSQELDSATEEYVPDFDLKELAEFLGKVNFVDN